jgi:hypothetical protein
MKVYQGHASRYLEEKKCGEWQVLCVKARNEYKRKNIFLF